ncbi:MAG: DUF2608 domain-containing protein [Holosporaceae bacterium]|jgi:hypothetical protein|nr:DUF2608 domain-containing protein [Holosporaceae bacterium]
MRGRMGDYKRSLGVVFCILLGGNVSFATHECDFESHSDHVSVECKNWEQVDTNVAQLKNEKIFGDFPVALIDYDDTIFFKRKNKQKPIIPGAVEGIKKFTIYGFSNFIITSGSPIIHESRKIALRDVELNNDISFKEELFNAVKFKEQGITTQQLEHCVFSSSKCKYLDGFLYCLERCNKKAKGESFAEFLQCLRRKPSYVIMVDDAYYNLCAVAETCKAKNIPFYTICIRFEQSSCPDVLNNEIGLVSPSTKSLPDGFFEKSTVSSNSIPASSRPNLATCMPNQTIKSESLEDHEKRTFEPSMNSRDRCLLAFSYHPFRQICCPDPYVHTVHASLALRFPSFLQEKSHYAIVSLPRQDQEASPLAPSFWTEDNSSMLRKRKRPRDHSEDELSQNILQYMNDIV